MKNIFHYAFEKRTDSIDFDIEDQINGYFKFDVSGENILLHANRKGFLFLAKAFLKMAMNDYKLGFHFHMPKDFNDESTGQFPEVIVFLIDKKEDIPKWD